MSLICSEKVETASDFNGRLSWCMRVDLLRTSHRSRWFDCLSAIHVLSLLSSQNVRESIYDGKEKKGIQQFQAKVPGKYMCGGEAGRERERELTPLTIIQWHK